jgi:hypothetical protein
MDERGPAGGYKALGCTTSHANQSNMRIGKVYEQASTPSYRLKKDVFVQKT